jgi:hypothetical protein
MEEEMYEEEDPDYERRKLQQHMWPRWDGSNSHQNHRATGWPPVPSNEALPFFAFQPSKSMASPASPVPTASPTQIQPQFNDFNTAMGSNHGTPLMSPHMSGPLSPTAISPMQEMQYEDMFMETYDKLPVNPSVLSRHHYENQLPQLPQLSSSNYGNEFGMKEKSKKDSSSQLSAEFNIQDFYTDPNELLEESANFEETTG